MIVFSTIFRNTSKKSNKQLQKPVSLTASCSSGRRDPLKSLLRKMTVSTENKRRLTYKQFLEKYLQKVIQISPRNGNNTNMYYGDRRYKIETRNMKQWKKNSVCWNCVDKIYIKYEKFSIDAYVTKKLENDYKYLTQTETEVRLN